ncbi:hypothetical protein L2E82_15306 [Cichorium intybus]|uniref:Uncharacterized protein n=1 Tax=Cichorium intybus TaxID=13427 RepID=A0ACB9F2U6_CICIN|nr:hypothetical protein L2E82_15306 [Cichorium intybus]
MFSTCVCARYQANPMESHVIAVKRIFKYLKGTPKLGLWYPAKSDFQLNAFTDSDYGGCKLDRKSTSGSCQFLGGRLVSWSSKKQSCVSTSTAEAEYVAAASCCSQVIWMQTQLRDYGFRVSQIPIFCDSTSAIAISHNPVHHSMTKHIDIRYHFIKDNIQKGHIELHFINTEDQIADVFTKALDETKCVTIANKAEAQSAAAQPKIRRPSLRQAQQRRNPACGSEMRIQIRTRPGSVSPHKRLRASTRPADPVRSTSPIRRTHK